MPKKRASLWGQHFSKYRKSAPLCRTNLPNIWGCVLFLKFPLSREKKIYPSPVNHLKMYPQLCRHKHQGITLSDLQRTLKRHKDRSVDSFPSLDPILTTEQPHGTAGVNSSFWFPRWRSQSWNTSHRTQSLVSCLSAKVYQAFTEMYYFR